MNGLKTQQAQYLVGKTVVLCKAVTAKVKCFEHRPTFDGEGEAIMTFEASDAMIFNVLGAWNDRVDIGWRKTIRHNQRRSVRKESLVMPGRVMLHVPVDCVEEYHDEQTSHRS